MRLWKGGPVSVHTFFFLLFLLSSLTQNRALESRFMEEKAMFKEAGERGGEEGK